MAAEVHPTAVVHPGTVLGEGVKVLEHAVVGKQPTLSPRSTAKREPLPPAVLGAGSIVSTGAIVFAGSAQFASIGYWLGGKLADRRPDPQLLGRLILVAALCIAATPFVARPILDLALRGLDAVSVGAVVGSFFAALALFAVPITLLGAVSPFAIRLALGEVAEAGTVVCEATTLGLYASPLRLRRVAAAAAGSGRRANSSNRVAPAGSRTRRPRSKVSYAMKRVRGLAARVRGPRGRVGLLASRS